MKAVLLRGSRRWRGRRNGACCQWFFVGRKASARAGEGRCNGLGSVGFGVVVGGEVGGGVVAVEGERVGLLCGHLFFLFWLAGRSATVLGLDLMGVVLGYRSLRTFGEEMSLTRDGIYIICVTLPSLVCYSPRHGQATYLFGSTRLSNRTWSAASLQEGLLAVCLS